eukprot:1863563-Amphidinium_carterae.1
MTVGCVDRLDIFGIVYERCDGTPPSVWLIPHESLGSALDYIWASIAHKTFSSCTRRQACCLSEIVVIVICLLFGT